MAPRGLVITLAGDPGRVAKEFPQINCGHTCPSARTLIPKEHTGVRYIAAGMRRLTHWHHFLDILNAAPDHVRTKLPTHYGHGNISVLLADTPHANNVSAD
jgi:hypothetical protein